MNKSQPLDIAAYIVNLSQEIGEPVTNMKLQKLVYYTYAWYAAEKGEPLFDENIEAWKYGPVIPIVYDTYKIFGADVIKKAQDGNPENLNEYTKLLIDDIFKIYGAKSAIELVDLTHSEAPWRDNYNPNSQDGIIPFEEIMKFYKARKAVIS